MTTSPTPFLAEIADPDSVIPLRTRIYFQERFRFELYKLVVAEFRKRSRSGMTKKQLARRLQKRPEQITRWLAVASNLTLDTVSDLLLGICGGEPELGVRILADQLPRNLRQPEWLDRPMSSPTTAPVAVVQQTQHSKVETIATTQAPQHRVSITRRAA